MEKVKEVVTGLLGNNLVQSALVIVVGLLIYKIVSAFLLKRGRKLKEMGGGKGETFLHLINSVIKYTVLIIVFLMLLQVNNVNVSSLIAGLGIAGVVLGLTVQDALKDIIRGFSIISDAYFKVGDLVNYKGTEGTVLELGLKTTKIRDIKTENIVAIPNRNIEDIQVVSDYIYLDIPLPYEVDLSNAEAIAKEIAEQAEKSNLVKSCTYRGVNDLGDSAIGYQLRVECGDNHNKLQIRRNTLHTILEVLEKHGISVPYTQIDIHNK